MKKNFFKKFLIFLIILGVFFGIRLVWAQDFGTGEVEAGLGGALAAGDPREMAGRIINIVLGFLGVIALGLITYAGYVWMTSEGNEEKIGKAKKTLISASIGLAIVLSAWAITTFVLNKLSGASHGGGTGSICVDGEFRPCGCEGSMYCSNGLWGPCIGGECGFGQSGPSTCDSSPQPGCQPNSDICAVGDYCNDSCVCVPRGATGDSCNLNPEAGVCSPDDGLCGEFLSCDPDSCTCTGPPVITHISPMGGFCEDDINISCDNDSECGATCNKTTPNGAVGNLITILGSGFGEYEDGVSRVLFSPNVAGRNPVAINAACVNTWTDSQVIISVPAGAQSGEVRVRRADFLEDSSADDYGPVLPPFIVNNIIRPGLCTVTPDKGLLGEDLVYQGINLYQGKAYFGNYSNNVEALNSDFSHGSGSSGKASLANIRDGQADSFVRATVGNNNEASNYLRVTKEPDPNDGPYIVSFSPESGRAGQYVTINGSGFGSNQSSSRVYFGSQEAEYDFPLVCANSVWTNNQIIVKVPEGLSNGNYFINIDLAGNSIDTRALNPNTFEVSDSIPLKSSLCKREPSSGTVGTSVKLYGEYFGQEGREGLAVFYNNKNTSGLIKKENKADVMTVSVPGGAISGPLKVVKNNQWGNELGFTVSSCKTNDDCLGDVCCPPNTYKSGRCVPSSQDCLIDIPTSVFEWDFSTAYKVSEISDSTESCNTLANYLGACQQGISCPNAAGVCSPYPGGYNKVVGECDYSCASIPGCQTGLSSTCSYNANINKCVMDGTAGNCSLDRTQEFQISGAEYEFKLTCNNDGNWELKTKTSCPDNWERRPNDVCINKNSSCDVCLDDLSCQEIDGVGRCASQTICPSGSICQLGDEVDGPDVCVRSDNASCDCCCEIGKSARDCCVPLECEGTCGSDTDDDGIGYGVCSGCAGAGTTQAERDQACNCEITSGQYCFADEDNPKGYCTDCSGLTDEASCNLHSSVCCFDARTNTCRGGSGLEISDNPNNPDYGYCAYYNCDTEDSSTCAQDTPVRYGFYKDVYSCETGCATSGTDACNIFNGEKDNCTAMPSCCYDHGSGVCQSGEKISEEGVNFGYCAYYDCGDPSASPPEDANTCITEQKLSGKYSNLDRCISSCGSTGGGSGKDCVSSQSVSTCNFDICNYPGMTCKTESGEDASDTSDCGVCCCNPDDPSACQTDASPDLYCQANVGNCSGESRGLCCGCTSDGDCGNTETVGCGLDTCCQARPELIDSMPRSGDLDVCRNAVLRLRFDQAMDPSTFRDGNVLLLQEMNYGDGVCPTGSFAYTPDVIKRKKGLALIIDKLSLNIKGLIARVFKANQTALANLPSDDKLYCLSDIDISSENMSQETIVNILPKKLLAPGANYYLVVKGDENLNSQTGVMAFSGIGFNGQGLEIAGNIIEGQEVKFNNNAYTNSHIVKFTTLSDKESNSGVCEINSVGVSPNSYLFNTTENSIDENDGDPNDPSFDTVRDRDKVFSAWAYSADDQVIQPVTGYFWRWKFALSNSDVASTKYIEGLGANRVMVEANPGVTDGETRLMATVDMTSFLGENAIDSPGCTCTDDFCSSNCLNAFSVGDNFSNSSNIYVFICNNPWPPVKSDGSWSPWVDNCEGYIGDGHCNDFSYKFYYCRDAGQPGTFDDLPAISGDAVIRGQSAVLSCSTDGSPCFALDSSCGEDRSGDGQPDGVCIWSVLKESYFFREKVLSPAEITEITDTRLGGELLINFKSLSADVKAYKVYYGQAGKAITHARLISLDDASCEQVGTENLCQVAISSLENNKHYQFRVSVISTKDTESVLSNAFLASPTDKTPPLVPTNFNLDNLDEQGLINFTWNAGGTDVAHYRLYRGLSSGLYGESYDTSDASNSLSLSKSKLSPGPNYFALSALDAYNNESGRSSELSFYLE